MLNKFTNIKIHNALKNVINSEIKNKNVIFFKKYFPYKIISHNLAYNLRKLY